MELAHHNKQNHDLLFTHVYSYAKGKYWYIVWYGEINKFLVYSFNLLKSIKVHGLFLTGTVHIQYVIDLPFVLAKNKNSKQTDNKSRQVVIFTTISNQEEKLEMNNTIYTAFQVEVICICDYSCVNMNAQEISRSFSVDLCRFKKNSSLLKVWKNL